MSMIGRTVTTSEQMLVAYNKDRRSLVIENNGSFRVFLSQDPANIATNGFPIDPGWSVGFQTTEGDEPELAVYAVAPAGSSDVRIVEQFGTLPDGYIKRKSVLE